VRLTFSRESVGDTGFEPSSADMGAVFQSHRRRVELASFVRFCVTDQASVTMIARLARMGNTAHPVPTLKFRETEVDDESRR
jgi:hypothetical protein